MSVADQIYENIKKGIISGEIEPGHRLFEGKVAESYKISRTPVREAFRRLEQDLLLERLAQGGVKVVEVTLETVEEIFGIRTVLEMHAITLACERITPEGIAALREIKARAYHALELFNSKKVNHEYMLKRLFELNSLFHETIYELTGSKYLIKFINEIRGLILRYRYVGIRAEKDFIQTWKEHSSLIDVIEKREKEKAVELIKQHMAEAFSKVIFMWGKK